MTYLEESFFPGQTNGPPPSPSQSVSVSFPLKWNKQSWKQFSIAILNKGNLTLAWQNHLTVTAKDRSWLF